MTNLVRQTLAQGGPSVVVASNQSLGGDPAPNVAKALCVEFGASPTARQSTTPGGEAAGKVVSIGEGVGGEFRVGQTVHCTGQSDGSWAEFFVARADCCTAADPGISVEDVAQMLTKPCIAYALAFERLKVARGQWLLLTAPTSTLGNVLVQMCKAKGVKTA